MTGNEQPQVEDLPENVCWEFLRSTGVGRLAVIVDGHPDIFPVNFVVDHGTVVFRTAKGTKLTAAVSESPVALEIDGYDAKAEQAWSIVLRGEAEQIRETQELVDTLSLPLFPWQAGAKEQFVRINVAIISGRRFKVARPDIWATPLSDARRASFE
ncbi:pyridoxamine 5'-phosphate oxidase family protein [Paenarthrobacter sp. PH39-S1]|nr:pyridoxamine 5'-phosphate oxidase family protein [Paenarthrobacter sp. PH39-S1]MDJ0357065.1 pyridoxamine 5'-phosphate oxidase family protein [Paenarthrobacter sp. PH39-S1]